MLRISNPTTETATSARRESAEATNPAVHKAGTADTTAANYAVAVAASIATTHHQPCYRTAACSTAAAVTTNADVPSSAIASGNRERPSCLGRYDQHRRHRPDLAYAKLEAIHLASWRGLQLGGSSATSD